MLRQLSHRQAVWLMVVVTLLWATAGMVTRHLEHARRFEVTFWRSLGCALALLALLAASKGRTLLADIRRSGALFWYSALCWGAMFTAFMVAMTMTRVGNVLVTEAAGPIFTALLARWALNHRAPAHTVAAMVVASLGIVLMYATQMGEVSWAATLIALCVPAAGAVNWTIAQHAHQSGHDVDLVAAVMAGSALSAAATLPLAWPLQANTHDMVLLGGLGVYQLAIPCALCLQCTRVLQAPEMSLLQLMEVVFGIVLAWLGANEAPTGAVLAGAVVVLGALSLNEWIRWRKGASAS